jgi:hypothetical protein
MLSAKARCYENISQFALGTDQEGLGFLILIAMML